MALLVATPWFLLASLRFFSLDRTWPLVSLTAFTPQILVAVAIPLVVALALRARYVAIAVAMAGLVLAGLVLPRAVSQDQPPAKGQTITLMSANLLAGSAANDGIERIVKNNDVDVLAMQEVTPIALRVLRERGLDKLLPHVVDSSRPEVAGSVIMSRLPIRERDYGRAAELAPWPEVVVPRAKLLIRSVHPFPPTLPEKTKVWQEDLRAMPPARPAPGNNLRVLLGDFNATLDHNLLRSLVARGYSDAGRATGKGFVPTWTSGPLLQLTIDHVLVDEQIAIESYDVFDLPRSDHNAVVTRIRLPG